MKSANKRKEAKTKIPGILKILILDSSGNWVEPNHGMKFKASRYERSSSGHLKRVKRSFQTLAEAKVFRNSGTINTTLNQATPQNIGTVMSFDELVESWKANWLLTSVGLSTQLRYRRYLKHFEYFSKMKVVDIDSKQIDAWIAYVKRPEYLATCNSTRSSYEQEFKVLRSILNYYSTRCNRSYRLPFLRDHLRMLKVCEKLAVKKDLGIDQVNAFLAELKNLCYGTSWEAIYYLAVMQYAIYGRIQEAAALHVEDFDLKNDRLEIKRKAQWLRAKGHISRITSGAKTNGGKVFESIPKLASKAFSEWTSRSGVKTGLLFTIDGKIIEYRQIQYRYDQALKNAGLPFSATHILRHASLTEAYSSCPDLLAVQKLAGHKCLQATQRYAKVRDAKMAEVQNQMDAKLSSISDSI